jgi:hypothetical protein
MDEPFKNAETRAVFHSLLEEWDLLDEFAATAPSVGAAARSLRRAFTNRYGARGAGCPTTTVLVRLALARVSWRQVAGRLIDMVARRES